MHLSRLPSGRWRVAVKHQGRRATATADTRSQAQREGARLLLEMGGTIDRHTATVADLLARYVTLGERIWSPTYLAEVGSVLERIPQAFTERVARTVTPTVVAALYHQLDWSPHRLRRLHEILSAAWNQAVRLELVAANPCGKVGKPSAPPRRLTIPTHGQAAAILNATTHPAELLAIRLAVTLGARRGEVVALQWVDVDVERATVTIRRSLAYTPASGVVEGNTKTGEAGHRVIAVDLPTIAMLRKERARQGELSLMARLPHPCWVLSDDAGVTPWRPDRLTHLFARVRREAGVSHVRLHDLRHYVATSMLEDGEAVHDVAYQLGHANTATTLSVYAHHLPGRGRESADKRAARLDASGESFDCRDWMTGYADQDHSPPPVVGHRPRRQNNRPSSHVQRTAIHHRTRRPHA